MLQTRPRPSPPRSGLPHPRSGAFRSGPALARAQMADWSQVLGLFSVGLGLSQLVAADTFARLIGLEARPSSRFWIRAVGIRELAAGVGLLSGGAPAPWLGARTAGDAMDLVLLGGALASGPPDPERTAGALVAVLGVAALDAYATAESASGRP